MISVLSMENVSNSDVTAFYMDAIYEAATSVQAAERFTFDKLPAKENLVVVATVVEAIKLLALGYKNIGVWIQGILPEESYLRHQSILRKAVLSFIERTVLCKAKVLFVVSKETIGHYRRKYGIDIAPKAVVMPCFNAELTDGSFQNKGGRYQKKIFGYAGSLAPWQCFDETVKMFAEIEKAIPESELRIFTRETTAAERACAGRIRNYRIACLSNSELQEALQEITYGFILRQDIAVNRVATPTKISSYMANGVIPIYTAALSGFRNAAGDMQYACCLKSVDDAEGAIAFCERGIEPQELETEFRGIFDTYYNRGNYVPLITKHLKALIGEADGFKN